MKLLVTGGTGFLGAHLVPRLLAAGHQVRLLSRSPPAALAEGLRVTWTDGHESLYPYADLRALCRCAGCTGGH